MSRQWVILKGEIHLRWILVLGVVLAAVAVLELRHPGTMARIISRAATGSAGIYRDITNSLAEIVRRLSDWYH